MHKKIGWWMVLGFFCFSISGFAQDQSISGFGGVESHPLFQMARRSAAERVEFARQKGAKCQITPDSRSFYLYWLPSQASSKEKIPIIATISGHGSWAFDEFFLWQPHAAKHGFGIVALQWWFGTGEKMNDYYLPRQLYGQFREIFQGEKIPPGQAVLHGFSRGSANIFGVTAFDCLSRERLFLITIANAGKPGEDFPINRDISQGKFGSQPFQNSHWIMYGGGKDPHPDRDGIPGMQQAKEWVSRLGGVVDLFIADQEGTHGGFHRNSKNIETALLLCKKKWLDTLPKTK